MQARLDAYRNALINGSINPHHQYDGQSSGLILDGADPDVPLQVISLAMYQLKDGPFAWETGIEEQVLVLQRGHCTVTVNEQTWTLARPHGVFAPAGGLLDALHAEETLVYASDWPHWDWDDPATTFPKLPERLHRRVFAESARELFGL